MTSESRVDNKAWWETHSLLPFNSPKTILMTGATMSGKTTLTFDILKHASGIFKTPPIKIIFAYGEYQPILEKMEKNIEGLILHQGLPSREQIEEWSDQCKYTVLILDDMMNQVTKNEGSLYLFCVTAHHRKVTVLFLTQNLYMPGKYARTISLYCHYVILFRNVRDARQVVTFGSKVFPGNNKYFKDAYDKATTHRYGYLLIDLSPITPEKYRVRTHILPNETTIVYAPRNIK